MSFAPTSSFLAYRPPVGSSQVQQPQYVTQPPVQYVSQPPVQYVTQPLVQSVVQAPVQVVQPNKKETRTEYVPYEKKVIEYEDQVITVQVPVEKTVTDYYPVEYEIEYVPRKTYETYTEQVPVERTREVIDYEPVERQLYRPPQVQYVQQPVQYAYQQPVQYAYQQPVQYPYQQYAYQQPVQYMQPSVQSRVVYSQPGSFVQYPPATVFQPPVQQEK